MDDLRGWTVRMRRTGGWMELQPYAGRGSAKTPGGVHQKLMPRYEEHMLAESVWRPSSCELCRMSVQGDKSCWWWMSGGGEGRQVGVGERERVNDDRGRRTEDLTGWRISKVGTAGVDWVHTAEEGCTYPTEVRCTGTSR